MKINSEASFAPSGNHSLNLASVYAVESMEHSESFASGKRVAKNLILFWRPPTDERTYLHMIVQNILIRDD